MILKLTIKVFNQFIQSKYYKFKASTNFVSYWLYTLFAFDTCTLKKCVVVLTTLLGRNFPINLFYLNKLFYFLLCLYCQFDKLNSYFQ